MDSNNLYGFSINPTTGALTVIPGSPFSVGNGSGPIDVLVDPTGSFLYTINDSSNNVKLFTLDATTGVPTAGANRSHG